MGNPGAVKSVGRTLDDEREYLESLLSSRFNFYILVSGAVVAGIGSSHGERLLLLLWLGTCVSALFWRALFRTKALVSGLIAEIAKSPQHPLAIARKHMKENHRLLPQEANHYIGQWIPGTITAFFLSAAVVVTWRQWAPLLCAG